MELRFGLTQPPYCVCFITQFCKTDVPLVRACVRACVQNNIKADLTDLKSGLLKTETSRPMAEQRDGPFKSNHKHSHCFITNATAGF